MKKLTLLIALFSTATYHLHADLFNGPWSPESQKLVKLAQNPAMPITAMFKGEEKQIDALRQLSKFNLLDPQITEEVAVNLKDAPIFYEAVLQILNDIASKITVDDDLGNIKRYAPLNKNSVLNLVRANFAYIIDNQELFESILKNSTQNTKDAILGFFVDKASSNRAADLLQFKKYIEIALKLGANPNGDFNDAMRPYKKIIQYYLPNINNPEKNDPILELLLLNDLNINTVFYIKSIKKQQTLLDLLLGGSSLASQNQELKDLIKYVKSKGAKTYAELQSK